MADGVVQEGFASASRTIDKEALAMGVDCIHNLFKGQLLVIFKQGSLFIGHSLLLLYIIVPLLSNESVANQVLPVHLWEGHWRIV
jgi:hypothetical protein